MNRRTFLSAAASAPLVVGPPLLLASPLIAAATGEPTDFDLRRYYAFLWFEHLQIAEHMGSDHNDAWTIDRPPSCRASIRGMLSEVGPESRALRVLAAAGLNP